MADHGGYRQPSKPAPVSGPGKYSKRTDGHPTQVLSAAPDQGYGEATQQMNDQRTAPMGAAAPLPPPAQVPSQDASQQTQQLPAFGGLPLSAPTTRPNEPITTGSDIGPGAGPEVMSFNNTPGMGQATGAMTTMLSQLAPSDGSGVVAALLAKAQQAGV